MQRRTFVRIPLLATILGSAQLAAGHPGDAHAAAPGRAPRVGPVETNVPLTTLFGAYGDTGGRWIGADSGYSVALPDGRIVWIWSDTFVGPINPDHTIPRDTTFIHNSLIVQDADGTLHTVHGGTDERPTSLFAIPGGGERATMEDTEWYWCADATVEGTDLVVCLLRFVKTGPDVFDFEFRGTALGVVSIEDFAGAEILQNPAPGRIHWGSALFADGGWTYVYGVDDQKDTKYLHLARVRAGSLRQWESWRFWTGSAWSESEADSVSLMSGVANEFSVTRQPAGLLLLTQDTTEALSADIVAYAAPRPTGPFTDKTLVHRTPETGGTQWGGRVFTYNAKAHRRRGGGPTLVTYNVNSFEPDDLYADARLYRPRFLDVDLTSSFEGDSR